MSFSVELFILIEQKENLLKHEVLQIVDFSHLWRVGCGAGDAHYCQKTLVG